MWDMIQMFSPKLWLLYITVLFPTHTKITLMKMTYINNFNQIFQAELQPMMKKGVCGFKCFLIHSGVDEFPHVVESDVCQALELMKGTNSVLLVCLIYSLLFSSCVPIPACLISR